MLNQPLSVNLTLFLSTCRCTPPRIGKVEAGSSDFQCTPPPRNRKVEITGQYEMLIFGLHSTSDDRLGWLMDSNPIHHPSPAKKMKYSFLDYVQLLMIGRAGRWTQTPSATPLQPKKDEMLIFGLCSTSDDQPGWSMDSNPICHPSPAKKNEMLIFGLHSTSDDRPGWLMDSNPICHPSPVKKMKCLFLGYVQLLMISLAGRWT